MGTARMGTDPERSVVDPFGRCHDVPNLFVVDASVFVTALAANPTATAKPWPFARRITSPPCAETDGPRSAPDSLIPH
jgi:choline dehydrogenase-like flavoprotein